MRKKEDKRRRIIAAARALFGEKGYDATTTQEVAKLAGIGSGTLFLYVSSKEELLLLAFLDEFSAVLDEAFAEIDFDAPMIERLMHIFDRIIRYHGRDPALQGRLLREMTFVQSEEMRASIGLIHDRIVSQIREMLEADQRAGLLRPGLDPVNCAATSFAIYFGSLGEWANGYAPVEKFRLHLRASLELLLIAAYPAD